MTDRREFRSLASAEELTATIEQFDLGGDAERVPLADATGRVLAERVTADGDVPGFDRATMDGYAVRAEDTVDAGEADPVTLSVVGSVAAGEPPSVAVGGGEAVTVATGAVIPEGATAVVEVEATTVRESGRDERAESVAVRRAVTPGEQIMVAGADVAAGTRVLGPGRELGPREVGLLAALGRDEVGVRTGPAVGVVSTGDELVAPGEELDPRAGQIHDVNGHAIASAVSEAGGEPTVYPRVGDDADAMVALLREAARENDLVLTSGSTSASATDVLYRVIEEHGESLLHGVAVKPGKPTIVGRIDGTAFVGLPGYPVSAATIFREFVAPAIRAAAGRPPASVPSSTATMATTERYEEGRRRFLPVGLVTDGDGRTLAHSLDRGSGATTTLADADGVIECDPDTSVLAEGQTVTVDLFSPSVRPPSVLVVGEADPTLRDVLDRLDAPRHLPSGARVGARSLADGVADVAVLAGPVEPAAQVDVRTLATWDREWGLLYPDEGAVPATLEAALDGPGPIAVLDDQWGLQASFEATLADRVGDGERSDLVATRGLESPAERVRRGQAAAGLGLAATAARDDLGFLSLGREGVSLVARTDRCRKDGVRSLAGALAAIEGVDGSDLVDDGDGVGGDDIVDDGDGVGGDDVA